MIGIILLGVVLLAALVLIPLGMPGTWVMVAAAVGYSILVPAGGIGTVTIVVVTVLAVIAEVMEWTLSARYARRYGGSRRAGWGAMLGGVAGAIIGVPVPIVGPILGALLGAFAGALVFELSRGTASVAATRVAWGALLGRVAGAALKVGTGVLMAVWLMIAAIA